MTFNRRLVPRFIKRVPIQITLGAKTTPESHSAETMNISNTGAYFATSLKLRAGVKIELRVRIPEEIKSFPPLECRFIGRVTHVEPLGNNGMSGVGVHFLCYSVDDAARAEAFA
jgi:hypothetical protein